MHSISFSKISTCRTYTGRSILSALSTVMLMIKVFTVFSQTLGESCYVRPVAVRSKYESITTVVDIFLRGRGKKEVNFCW
jgi:hypothetical protein